MSISLLQVETALKEIVDPYLEQDLVTAKCVKNISVANGEVGIDVVLGFPAAGYHEELAGKLRAKIQSIAGVTGVVINLTTKIVSHSVQKGIKPIHEVKNIIAIASGKGGVGKSTTAVNLALALVAEGANAGLLDADIYGPSQPRMLGIHGKPESKDGKSMEPVVGNNIQSMSIGYLIEEETPMIWRGPMVTQALEQLFNDTNWHDLDYLLVDLPPGTGDTQLTLAQKVPVSGVVIITTPQDISLLDARKGLKMFAKVDVRVLGVVENMSIHICSQCGHEEHIFGEGGGGRLAEEQDIALLGVLPLDGQIRAQTDDGNPPVIADPNGRVAHIYREIARRMTAKLSLTEKDYSAKFPKIVVQND